MSSVMLRFLLGLLFFLIIQQNSVDGQAEDYWCIADEQTPDEVLEGTIRWACTEGGADCTNIQEGQPCYLPNTLKDHASYVFNNYYQKFKHEGATCFFYNAAMLDERDPSHGSCKFELLP